METKPLEALATLKTLQLRCEDCEALLEVPGVICEDQIWVADIER